MLWSGICDFIVFLIVKYVDDVVWVVDICELGEVFDWFFVELLYG